MNKYPLLLTIFLVGCSANSPTSSLTHTHIAGTPVIENKVEATCEKNGSYDEVIYCIEDNVEMSRNKITLPSLGHIEETIKANSKDATYEEEGWYDNVTYCSRCYEILSQETIFIPKLASEGLNYQLNNDSTCSIKGIGSCTDNEIIIPEYIDGFKVTSIANNAFENCINITKVRLSDFIIEIGESAFENCINLIDFIPNEELNTISNRAFYGCTSLSEFTLPKMITTLGNDIFKNCNNFTTLYYNCNKDISSQVHNLFLTSPSITKIIFGGTQIPKYMLHNLKNVKEIEILGTIKNISKPYFSYNETITTVTIREGVEEIGTSAFSNCKSLESITIPKSIKEIHGGAFVDCTNLTNVYYAGTLESWCNIKFGSENAYSCPMDRSYYYGAKNFYIMNENNEWSSFPKDIIIPETITSIGYCQFSGFRIESVELPNTITIINTYAFDCCLSLKKIIIPDSVLLIEEGAFGMSNWNYNGNLQIYYTGTQEQWENIVIKKQNTALESATIHYEYSYNV